jgi:succinyl-CoA synthetase beta subunit
MLGMRFWQFPVTAVLVEERLSIAGELFVPIAIDEATRAAVLRTPTWGLT